MICANLSKVYSKIEGLPVTLIAVSKTKPVAAIIEAYNAGVRNFGENYLQEALPKLEALQAYPITWHYLGRLQTKKLKEIATHFAVIHSLDRLEHAQKLNKLAEHLHKKLQVFVQVNLDGEPQKGGVLSEDIHSFIEGLSQLDHLEVLGLMLIPKPSTPLETLQKFQSLREMSLALYPKIKSNLSMGMSEDYELALAAGATHIRLGTVIFGPRT